ncbi:hypothetical protein [Nonomuraea sp. NPDC049141]|uniref:hypothetical protein n=1 Tax=Nonomuraea sp. NPDC049141 TaxID=3155500 RepID=UPI0033D6B3EE
MAVRGHRTYRYTVEVYRDGTQGSAGETQTHVWDVIAEDQDEADLMVYARALETIRPLLDAYRVITRELVVPRDATHWHVDVHAGPTPASVVGWGSAWSTLADAVEDMKGSLGSRVAGTRVAAVTCEETSCWT